MADAPPPGTEERSIIVTDVSYDIPDIEPYMDMVNSGSSEAEDLEFPLMFGMTPSVINRSVDWASEVIDQGFTGNEMNIKGLLEFIEGRSYFLLEYSGDKLI